MNGSMGLPIILVCKLENNRLIKIVDQGEWQIVKEYLKNIIAGNQIEFVKVDSEIAADDIYYTQLTLPVPSFDALKNAYDVEETNNTAGILNNNLEPEVEPVMPQVETPIAAPQPVVQEGVALSAPVIDIPVPETPIIDVPVSETPIISAPEVDVVVPAMDLNTPMPTFGSAPVAPTPVVEPVMPEPVIEPTQVVNDVTSGALNEVDMFKEQKEAFMQACENMFDALVQKFQKELENRK